MERPISVGSVVYSRAGPAEGRFYVVYKNIDDGNVTIIDGDVRKVAKPKKKKLKHLKNTGEVLEPIAEKIRGGEKLYDRTVCEALKKYNS